MKWLCKIFGHRMPEAGWWGDGKYGCVSYRATDGIDRTHYEVELECPTCGSWWVTARFHGSDVREVRELRAKLEQSQ